MQTASTTMTTQQMPSTTSDGVAAAHAHPDPTKHCASSSSSSSDSLGNFQLQDSHFDGQLINTPDQKVPARWDRVEPWLTLLCKEGEGGEDEEGTDEGLRRSEELQVCSSVISCVQGCKRSVVCHWCARDFPKPKMEPPSGWLSRVRAG